MGNRSEFHRAVQLVIEFVSFEKDNTVQVFEATIRSIHFCPLTASSRPALTCVFSRRVLGALLSAHLILTDPDQLLGDFRLPGYDDELLLLAHDLASRLIPAFEGTATGTSLLRSA